MKRVFALAFVGLLLIAAYAGAVSCTKPDFAPQIASKAAASLVGEFAQTRASDSWTTKQSMPTARIDFGVGVVNGKIYAIGGYKPGSGYLAVNEEYDPINNTWIAKSPMPTTRYGFSVAVVNGKIYAIGGVGTYDSGNLKIVEEYDPAADNWTTKTPMPTGRSHCAIQAVSNKIYAIGGYRYYSISPGYYDGTVTDKNEEYDPAIDSWTTKAPMPSVRGGVASATLDGKIYVLGGITHESGGWSTSPSNPQDNKNERYDPSTNSWDTMKPLPTATGASSAESINGKIYLIGGFGPSDKTQEYNPSANSWTARTPMPTPRYGLAIAAANGKIYAIGGKDSANYLTKNEEYTPYVYVPPTNNPPVASISASPPSAIVGAQVSFNGGNSHDPDSGDSIAQFYFDYGDGQNSGWTTSFIKLHGYSTAGTYIVSLSVKDESGLESTSPSTITIIVTTQVNSLPSCEITSPKQLGTVSDSCLISVSVSDSDGIADVSSVEVKIDDGSWLSATFVSGTTWQYNWDTTTIQSGQHTIYARAYDGTGYSSVQSTTVIVDNDSSSSNDNATQLFKNPLFLAIILLIVFVVCAICFYFYRNRDPKDNAPKEPEKEKVKDE
jgi:N-acetylneuraminic acid mutarotase